MRPHLYNKVSNQVLDPQPSGCIGKQQAFDWPVTGQTHQVVLGKNIISIQSTKPVRWWRNVNYIMRTYVSIVVVTEGEREEGAPSDLDRRGESTSLSPKPTTYRHINKYRA